VSFAVASHCESVQVKVATGNGHGVLLKADGTVWSWGVNTYGQLGNGEGSDSWAPEPEQVPAMTSIRDVACGDNFTVVVKDDGTVWAWGDNDWGELGNGAVNPSAKPAQIDGLTGVAAVAATRRHALALRSDGAVWEWGGDPKGSRPKLVEKLSDVVAVADGYGHSVALKSDGTVWVWGDHGAGDLGNGCYNNAPVPIRLCDLSDIAAVAAGYQLTVAAKKDGTVWAVGYGAAGGLGDGAVRNESTKPVMVSGLTGVKAVAAGYMHVVALKGDGTVWSWGYNHDGQLGILSAKFFATGGRPEVSPEPVRSGSLSGVVAVAAGYNHSVALTGHGTLWAWGDNEDGALGTDKESLARSEVPMKVGQSVPDKCSWLFSCQTGSGRYIRICGEPDEDDSSKWSNIQYRFGPGDGPPELVFPKDPSKGEPPLFFSHEEQKGEYRVSVRFSTGGYAYRVYSTSKGEHEGGAGVTVSDSKGKLLSDISCAERPEIFIEYLRKALPCDPKNPHGAAACKESPYRVK
jgi:alpha-tubulin suppressor-like RCC1 family protein